MTIDILGLIFQKNGYPKNFIDRCFNLFLSKSLYPSEKVSAVESAVHQRGTYCCKLQVSFKSQNKLCNNFNFKDPVPQILALGLVYKFQHRLCNKSYYGEDTRHLAVRSGEHIVISFLTSKRVQPRNDSVACHQLLNCNYSSTFEDFSVLCYENKKYLLELKESLRIKKDKPSLNRNIRWVFFIYLN